MKKKNSYREGLLFSTPTIQPGELYNTILRNPFQTFITFPATDCRYENRGVSFFMGQTYHFHGHIVLDSKFICFSSLLF